MLNIRNKKRNINKEKNTNNNLFEKFTKQRIEKGTQIVFYSPLSFAKIKSIFHRS